MAASPTTPAGGSWDSQGARAEIGVLVDEASSADDALAQYRAGLRAAGEFLPPLPADLTDIDDLTVSAPYLSPIAAQALQDLENARARHPSARLPSAHEETP